MKVFRNRWDQVVDFFIVVGEQVVISFIVSDFLEGRFPFSNMSAEWIALWISAYAVLGALSLWSVRDLLATPDKPTVGNVGVAFVSSPWVLVLWIAFLEWAVTGFWTEAAPISAFLTSFFMRAFIFGRAVARIASDPPRTNEPAPSVERAKLVTLEVGGRIWTELPPEELSGSLKARRR